MAGGRSGNWQVQWASVHHLVEDFVYRVLHVSSDSDAGTMQDVFQLMTGRRC